MNAQTRPTLHVTSLARRRCPSFRAQRRWRRGRRYLLSLAAAAWLVVLAEILLLRALGLQWNLSASMPLGLYLPTERSLLPGEIVAVCLPAALATLAKERGYLHHGSCPTGVQPVLKRIAAVAGDVVTVQPEGVMINDTRIPHSQVATQDSQGRTLPHAPWGTRTLQHQELWLMSTLHPHSLDSRTFGVVSIFDVIATATPLAVLETSPGGWD
jgi:conjugative transfer signal peptidase TraF